MYNAQERMKTIILCGGIGYRLKEETEFKPKPMVNVGNKPILWHIMKTYAHFGFNEFIIALGYKGDYIKDYFLNQKYFTNDFTLHTKTGRTMLHKDSNSRVIDNFVITFVDTGQETLPGERILRCKDYIPAKDKHFMVTYGDGVGNVNIPKLIRFHKKQKTIGAITGVHPRSKYGVARINDGKFIFRFEEKPVLADWTNGGFMVFHRSFFSYLKPGETEHPALERLSKIKQLSLYIHDGFWHSMDTYSDVESLNRFWQEDPKWKVWKD
ncbi:MAG: Glucose-1-phosphate cytidylyltransferase [Candidatus Gottesmanbacteria bacterium GW2011_GWA2_47_9]|uniref:Glucose-1-phosphate cytidylyltransferase n=2 Tax=Microgenomates group TaxID=1794810 RepID=A0A0G1X391_9BACT|nr:MAG: Glucose-1-phosphate cytidylyltransferase [Candidatus Gottesmanbacteria bacterium GW2011_GWA2_47_9]